MHIYDFFIYLFSLKMNYSKWEENYKILLAGHVGWKQHTRHDGFN